MKKVWRVIWKFFRGLFLVLLVLYVTAMWALRSEAVQNKLVPIVENALGKALKTKVEIGRVYISFPLSATLENVILYDLKDQPMIAAEGIHSSLINLSLWNFITAKNQPKRIEFSHIQVDRPMVKVVRYKEDSTVNISLFSQLGGKGGSGGGGIELDFSRVNLYKGSFSYEDQLKARRDTTLANGKLDFGHLNAYPIDGSVGFELTSIGQMHAQVHRLSVRETYSGMILDDLSGKVSMYSAIDSTDGPLLCLEEIELVSGQTEIGITGGLDLAYHDTDSTKTVAFDAHLNPSKVDFQTINFFMPQYLPLQGVAGIQGPVGGTLNHIHSDSLYLTYGKDTRIRLSTDLEALTDRANGPKMKFVFQPGNTSFEDINALLITASDIPLSGKFHVLGTVFGDLRQFRSEHLVVTHAEATHLNLKATLTDYSKPDKMLLDVAFADSRSRSSEIRNLLSGVAIPAWMNNLGEIQMDGHYTGGIRDFVVEGKFNTSRGNIMSNLRLTLPVNQPMTYKGWVDIRNFDLDGMGISLSAITQHLNFNGEIQGEGTDFHTMNTEIFGEISQTPILGYMIDFLGTQKISIRNDSIFGTIDLLDPQGDATLALNLDFSDTVQHFTFLGDISKVDLKHYGITTDTVRLTSVVNVRIDGDSLENYTGRAKFFSLKMERPNGELLEVHDMRLYSRENSIHSKNLEFRSSLFDFDFRSNLSFKRGSALVDQMKHEGILYLGNNDSLTQAYYAQKERKPETDSIAYSFAAGPELNEFLKFFRYDAHIGSKTRLDGNFKSGTMELVDFVVHFDTLSYEGYSVRGDSANFNLTKSGLSNELVAIGNVDVGELKIGDNLAFDNIHYEAQFAENYVDQFLFAEQPDFGNQLNLHATTEFLTDTILTKINPRDSEISFKNEKWRVSTENRVIVSHGEVYVDNLELSQGTQSILANGTLSKSEDEFMSILVRRFDLETLQRVLETNFNLGGIVTLASAKIFSGLDKPQVQFTGQVKDFSFETIDSVLIDFQGGWSGGDNSGKIGLSTTWSYKGVYALKATGYYDFLNDYLRFSSEETQLPLAWTEPFVKDFMREVRGTATIQDFSIQGKLKQPRMKGRLTFRDTQFKVNFLNNAFQIPDGGYVLFNNEHVNLDGLTLSDTMGHVAQIGGEVNLFNLDNIGLDVKVWDMENFLVMNTTVEDNSLFYGLVAVESLDTTHFGGTLNKIDIRSKVRTSPGTWLDIPISDYSSSSRLDFVNFIAHGDTTEEEGKKIDLSGFLLDLTIEPTTDAKIRLIFDEQVGDIIEAKGEGAIDMFITDKGEFLMTGYYEVEKGDYLFTAQNIVNKKFTVQKGGRITWAGDPFDAQLDLAAVYSVKADASDILQGNSSSGKIPVDIIMFMTGTLQNPHIDLQLSIENLSSDDAAGVASYFRNIENDQQELNKQVVSLLMFRRFAPNSAYYGGNSSGGSGVTSSISELISNQLNYWLSQAFDSNVGVELNTNDFDQVELALRASFFNNRVSVERNGTIMGNRTGQVSVGDISVLVKLLPAPPKDDSTGKVVSAQGQGQLVLEIFNRENYSISNANSNTTGAGVFYKKDFDRLIDLLKNKRAAKKEESPEL